MEGRPSYIPSSHTDNTDSTRPVEIQAPFDFGTTKMLDPDRIPNANVESNQTNPEDHIQTQNLHERCNTGSSNILKPAALSLYYNYTVGNLTNELMNIDPLSLKAGKMRLSSANLNPTDTKPAYSTDEDFVLAFPKLFDCKDPVSCIASELNPEKIFELVESFKLSGIRTVGDLSRCNSKRLEKIPIVTLPYCSKLQQARLALSNYHSDPQVKMKGEAAYENSLSAIYHYGFSGLRKGALETHSPQEVLQDNASWCPPRPEPVPSPPEVWLYPTTLQIMANTWPEPTPSSTENVAVTQTNPNYGTHSEHRAPEIKAELEASRSEREAEVLRPAQRESTPDDSMENFHHNNFDNQMTNEKSNETFGCSSVPPEDPYDGVKQNRGHEVVISVDMESNFDVLLSNSREIGNISNRISEPGPIEVKLEENLELSNEYQIDVDEMLKLHLELFDQLPDLGAKD